MSQPDLRWTDAPRPPAGTAPQASPATAPAAGWQSPPPSSFPASGGSMPRAAWVAIALLGLISAALAGALLMRVATPATQSPDASAAVAAAGTAMMLPSGLQAGLSPQGAQGSQLQPLADNVGTTGMTGTTGATGASRLPATDAAPAAADASPHRAAADPSPHRAAPVARAVEPAPVRHSRAPVAHRPAVEPVREARATVCRDCGVVESVVPLRSEGQGTGLGAVGGGVLGAVVGNQMGGGNGKKAMAVLGAIGGGFAGNEVEKRVRSTTVYEVRVRMEDGSRRTLRQEQPPAVGTRLVLDGRS